MKPNELTGQIIGAAIEVHRELGPGKPEAAYEAALAIELTLRGIAHEAQRPVPVVYKGVKLECGYRLDVLVANSVVVEAKSVEIVHPLHRAQVLTYLRLGSWKVALLLNFNVAVLKQGIERLVLGLEEPGRATAESRWSQRTPLAVSSKKPSLHRAVGSGDPEIERLANEALAAALEMHHELGPGLLPSTYEVCLCYELHLRGIAVERRKPLPLAYKGHPLVQADEIELLLGGKLVVKPCALVAVQPVHEAELLSQLRLGSWKVGLLINFNTLNLGDGIHRIVLGRER